VKWFACSRKDVVSRFPVTFVDKVCELHVLDMFKAQTIRKKRGRMNDESLSREDFHVEDLLQFLNSIACSVETAQKIVQELRSNIAKSTGSHSDVSNGLVSGFTLQLQWVTWFVSNTPIYDVILSNDAFYKESLLYDKYATSKLSRIMSNMFSSMIITTDDVKRKFGEQVMNKFDEQMTNKSSKGLNMMSVSASASTCNTPAKTIPGKKERSISHDGHLSCNNNLGGKNVPNAPNIPACRRAIWVSLMRRRVLIALVTSPILSSMYPSSPDTCTVRKLFFGLLHQGKHAMSVAMLSRGVSYLALLVIDNLQKWPGDILEECGDELLIASGAMQEVCVALAKGFCDEYSKEGWTCLRVLSERAAATLDSFVESSGGGGDRKRGGRVERESIRTLSYD